MYYIYKFENPAGPITSTGTTDNNEEYYINQAENDSGITRMPWETNDQYDARSQLMSTSTKPNTAPKVDTTTTGSGYVSEGGGSTNNNSQQGQPIDYYNDYKNVINLNSNRYRGLGKRRRLRDDLRRAGKDALVWNGAEAQRATNFLSGNRFSARDARNAIRNGRQNAYTFDANKFQPGTIERDANVRMNAYFSDHPNATNAEWSHGTWQRPTPTQPGTINVQNTTTTPAVDWEKKYNELKERLGLLEKGAGTQNPNPNNTTNPTGGTGTGRTGGTGGTGGTKVDFNKFATNYNWFYDQRQNKFLASQLARYGITNYNLYQDSKNKMWYFINKNGIRFYDNGKSWYNGKWYNRDDVQRQYDMQKYQRLLRQTKAGQAIDWEKEGYKDFDDFEKYLNDTYDVQKEEAKNLAGIYRFTGRPLGNNTNSARIIGLRYKKK